MAAIRKRSLEAAKRMPPPPRLSEARRRKRIVDPEAEPLNYGRRGRERERGPASQEEEEEEEEDEEEVEEEVEEEMDEENSADEDFYEDEQAPPPSQNRTRKPQTKIQAAASEMARNASYRGQARLRVPEPLEQAPARRARPGRPPATPANSPNRSSGRSVSPVGDAESRNGGDLHRRSSRSVYLLGEPIRALVHASQENILQKTLFCEPLPSPETLLKWIRTAWAKASEDMERQAPLEAACTRQVFAPNPQTTTHSLSDLLALESLELTRENIWQISQQHCRVRSHLVSAAKVSIIQLYELDEQNPESIRNKVEYLLVKDRFMCLESTMADFKNRFLNDAIAELIFLKYYRGRRMRGRSDAAFSSLINKEFICFVTAALQYNLKAWKTGMYVEPVDFTRESCYPVWRRHCSTWDAIALKAPEWEAEVLHAILYEVERKVARVTRRTVDESAAPWSDDDDGDDHMGELRSRKRKRDLERGGYQGNRNKARRNGSESPHPEDKDQAPGPVNIPTLLLEREIESEIETEVDTPPPTPTADTRPPTVDDMQVDLSAAVASFEQEMEAEDL